MTTAQGRFGLPDDSVGMVTFAGRLLASESSYDPEDKRRRQRWTEISIYSRADGGYVTHVVGRSLVEGERDLFRTKIVPDPAGVYEELVHGERPIWIEADALSAAAERDTAIAAWLKDRLEVEDLDEIEDLDSGTMWGQTYVVERDRNRALRFHGVVLGRGSSLDPGDPSQRLWSEFTVFGVSETRQIAYPRYVLYKVQYEAGVVKPRRAVAWVVRTGKEAIVALKQERKGKAWLESAAFDALDAAAAASPHFEASLEGLLDNNAHHAVFGYMPVLKPTGRDARRQTLTIMATGARLVTVLNEFRVVRWIGSDEPLPPQRVFSELSYQRLIRVVREEPPQVAGTKEWVISDMGRAALRAAIEAASASSVDPSPADVARP